jgi:Asparagine synthase
MTGDVNQRCQNNDRMRETPGEVNQASAEITSSLPKQSLDAIPIFRGPDGELKRTFREAVRGMRRPVELDSVAVASMVSFQYVIDGRSLVSQVRRQSWLSQHSGEELAGYGRRIMKRRTAADELLDRLRFELAAAFANADRITVLLSGGLDSRLVGGVLAGLARCGTVTDRIRAVTWGMPESRDRFYGARVAEHLGFDWIPIELTAAELAKNIEIAAHELAGLVSPVHLHAMNKVSQLDWSPGDRILASTLGNGVGRGQYLYQHVSYAKPLQPRNWLGLVRPEVYAEVVPRVVEELAAFRTRLSQRCEVAVHECEMLGHYVAGLLLPPFDFLRRMAAPVHQAFSYPATYRFLWSLSPMIRTEGLYRTALRRCDRDLVEIPYAHTGRAPQRLARPVHDGLSPHVHRYPVWITRDLAEIVDDLLLPEWFTETGLFDGGAVWRAWERIRSDRLPHAQTAYILLWLCSLRRLMEALHIECCADPAGTATCSRARVQASATLPVRPPWGFAGRDRDGRWQRLVSIPRQLAAVARCLRR